MQLKPDAKPVVLGWLNPLANGCLTLKQNKTKQNKAGFGSSCLLVNLTSKVLSLASSLCGLVLCGSFERKKNDFPQVFNRVFNNGTKWG